MQDNFNFIYSNSDFIDLIVYQLAPIFNQGVCVLLGVLIGEVTLAVLYYILLKYFFKKSADDLASISGARDKFKA